MIKALLAYRRAFDNGSMHGAEALGSARQIRQWDVEPNRSDVLEKSEDEWTAIAVESGSITAQCRYSNRHFGWMDELTEMLGEPSRLEGRIERYLVQEDPDSWTTSLNYLQKCALAKKLSFPPKSAIWRYRSLRAQTSRKRHLFGQFARVGKLLSRQTLCTWPACREGS
ncbi:MAG: hypothetical protein AAGA73_02695 [Pseudomonadota bacterium]